jgi:hypothetical protein
MDGAPCLRLTSPGTRKQLRLDPYSFVCDPVGVGVACGPRDSFWSEDFEHMMHGVWMILLHPHVHQFDEAQQQDVIEYVYENIYAARQPITQSQDHLFIHALGAIA